MEHGSSATPSGTWKKTKNCAELLRRLKENCIGHKMALQNSSATFDPRKTPQLL
jgi:hypothetical protein